MILGRGDWFSGGLPSRILRRGWLPYHSFSPKIWRIHPGVQGGKPGSNSVSGSKPPMVTSISAPNGREHHNSNARAFHRRGCEKISIMSIQSRAADQSRSVATSGLRTSDQRPFVKENRVIGGRVVLRPQAARAAGPQYATLD